ncbi:putative MFS family arabinose efflux permease [Mesocricetibacter intestinalis]|uniref:Putative MFS family arabinose efflux permease n=1 Tax=Mesocricetibacter intestinalis TaxID=1521930 RepID=A0A4R6VB72_9PAST|nr:MFS transporter [Mesocricetibacter intestinalis]TDQ56830.1 putative MFS family arabinose efflux permease [Mesocricetibacter intestinalis]
MMKNNLSPVNPRLLIIIMSLGVFGIINTEMGVVGIIPMIAESFNVSVPQAGWTVSAFALIVALSAPLMPLLCSAINRKYMMVFALGLFVLSNIISALSDDFTLLIIARMVPAFLHPVYVSMAFTLAAGAVAPEDAPKAVSRVFIGVSAGMVLGVPLTTFIAGHISFSAAMWFFTLINGLVLLATLFILPSMPVKEKLSYGRQLSVLKTPLLWYALLSTVLINGGIFGFFSYMSDFLHSVTEISFDRISLLLLVYGGSNILGNIVAGRLLAAYPLISLLSVPPALALAYIMLYYYGDSFGISLALLFMLGTMAGTVANNMQYTLIKAAPKAPDFANGLFLASANLGTMFGTLVCGMVITRFGTLYSPWGAVSLLSVGLLLLLLCCGFFRHQSAE